MNNSNENLEKDLKEELKDDYDEKSEDLQNNEIGLNSIMETQEDHETNTEESYVEEVGIEIANSMNETTEEILETQEIEEELLKQQLRDFHRNLIEASLYAAGRPLNIEEISNKLEFPKKEVEELINEVAFEYLERSTALIIAQIGDRYQMQIRPEYTEKVSKFAKGGAIAERYLRTLTIIALKQPILKSMVIKLRGTGAYEHVKYLIDNGFIDAVKKGRSQELTTTDKYADMFGLPKNKIELKRAMVTQLGISEDGNQIQPTENDDENKKDTFL
ncbi:MAG: SMC-Scp complex subunit ScpB [Promethearchaeota archaeon]|jgi:segregation and condensation protein B